MGIADHDKSLWLLAGPASAWKAAQLSHGDLERLWRIHLLKHQ